MELLLIILPFAAALITVLFWTAWRGRERAALWWIGAAIALCASALIATPGIRAALDLAPGGPLGPLSAWLLYRGAVEFAGVPPSRVAVGLAIAGSVAWLGFNAAGWLDSARYFGLASELPLTLVGAAAIARHAATPIQRLLAATIAMLAVSALLDPWLRDATGGATPRATIVWIAVAFPTALLMACALMERRTLRANLELRESENLLAEAQRVAHVGSWSLEPETGLLEWSDEKFRIHGYEPGSIDPWDALRAGIVVPEDRNTIESAVATAIDDGETVITEIAFVRADGEPARVSDHAVLVSSPDGRSRILGATLDVTEQRRSEAELERHRGHLEEVIAERTAQLEVSMKRLRTSERLVSLGTLAAGIAHQINNPVASILASAQVAQILEGGPEEQEAARRALRDIEREARRCGEIAHSVLQFASDRKTEKREQPLAPVLARAVRATVSYASSRGAVIHFDGDIAEFELEMSAIEIEQAVVNLLRNAVEANPGGAAVRISCSEKGERLLIHVDDDGCGIPPEKLERVFDPFFTRGKEGGTGLGLSVAHGIATEHGGSLWIESEENRGTRVTLALPTEAREPRVAGQNPAS